MTIGNGGDLRIGAGRFYVSGVAVENFTEHSIADQPNYPGYAAPDPALPENAGVYLVVFPRFLGSLSH